MMNITDPFHYAWFGICFFLAVWVTSNVIRYVMANFTSQNVREKFVILDVPLLLENKLNKPEDVIIYIDAKKKTLQKFLKRRSGHNPKIIKLLKELQFTPEKKKISSDIIINNNFNPKKMRLRAKELIDSIII